jgi:hypothetical protein
MAPNVELHCVQCGREASPGKLPQFLIADGAPSPFFSKSLGNSLLRLLSQEALAHAAELDRSYVSGLERGEFNVSLLALARLAAVLGVRLHSLIDPE